MNDLHHEDGHGDHGQVPQDAGHNGAPQGQGGLTENMYALLVMQGVRQEQKRRCAKTANEDAMTFRLEVYRKLRRPNLDQELSSRMGASLARIRHALQVLERCGLARRCEKTQYGTIWERNELSTVVTERSETQRRGRTGQ